MTRKSLAARSLLLPFAICSMSIASADEYQELMPTAVHSGVNAVYIVIPQNLGLHGCSLNRNSIAITSTEHSADFVKASLSIALASIATGTPMKVFWSGCMTNGRPKVSTVSLGTTELN